MSGEDDKAALASSTDMDLVALPDSSEAWLEDVKKRVSMSKRMIAVVLSVTESSDWIDLGGRPYLGISGVAKVRRDCGISITGTSYTKDVEEDDRGKYYRFTYTGTFSLPSGKSSIEEIGACSSRDQFFSMAHGKPKADSEIDITSIQKAAMTNLSIRGVTRLLGLQGITWEQIESAGIKKEGMSKVDHSSYKAQVPEDQLKVLREKILLIVDGDKAKATAWLKAATEFPGSDGKMVPGKEKLEFLSAKQYPYALSKAEAELAKRSAAPGK